MHELDIASQKVAARLLSALADRDVVRKRPLTILKDLGRKALTDGVREAMRDQLASAGIQPWPSPDKWGRETPWIEFRRAANDASFSMMFASERELSDFIASYWRRIPLFAGFSTVVSQYHLDNGRLICDLLLTKPRSGGVVVIELKRGEPGDEALSELFKYVDALQRADPLRPVEAWLMTGAGDSRVRNDLSTLAASRGIVARWYTYGVSFNAHEVHEASSAL